MHRILSLVLVAASLAPGIASAGRPSIPREARRVGLVGEAGEAWSQKVKGRRGYTERWKRWTNAQGKRWEIETFDSKGRLAEHLHGLQLENGRYLLIDHLPKRRRTHVTSHWTANGVKIWQDIERKAGQTTFSRRTAGNQVLRRVTGTGIDTREGAPLRYRNTKYVDSGSTMEAMPILATQLDHAIEAWVGNGTVIAYPGESYQTVHDRAQALGALPW